MKKPKFSMGPGGIKGFLAMHVEKIVLGLVMLLVAWFLYSGYSLSGYNVDRNPIHLRTQTQDTNQFILKDTALARVNGEAERAIIDDHKTRAEKSQVATSGGDYPLVATNQPNFPSKKKRGDVKILSPEMVEVRSFVTSIYTANESGVDPYAEDTTAVLKGSGKKADSGKKKDDGAGLLGGAPPAPGGDAGGLGAADGGKKKGGGKSAPPGMGGGGGGKSGPPGGGGRSGPPGGASGPVGGASGPGAAGGSGASGSSGPAGAMGGGVGAGGGGMDDYIRQYVDWSPKRGGGMAGNNQMQGGNTAGAQTGKMQYVVSILACVPHEKMVDEYTDLFSESMDYEPSRDAAPRYAGVFVDRAEIPDDPSKPLEWVRVRRSDYEKRSQQWPLNMPEIADDRYVDPKITFATPPAMLVDPVKFGLHSQIPQANTVVEQVESGAAPARKGDDSSYDENAPFSAGGAPAGGAGGVGGAAGFAGAGAGGAGGAGGASGPPGGFGGSGGGSGRPGGGMGSGPPGGGGMGSSGRPGGGMGGGMGSGGMGGGRMGSGPPGGGGMGSSGRSGGGMAGGGMSGGGMAGGGAGGFSQAQPAVRPTKYKMIRFFDFDAVPGKKYKYRVKLLVEDPNNPNPEWGSPAPADRYLDTTVAARVKESRKRWWLESEWSKESDSIGLPSKVEYVAGPVEVVNYLGLAEPSGKLVAVTWDEKRGARVPGVPLRSSEARDADKAAVFRGTLLNFVSKEAKVLRPDTLEIKGVKDHSTVTNAVVLDMRPGIEIVSNNVKATRDKDRKPLRSSGEFLLLDDAGNLVVRDELEDFDGYRKYTYEGVESQASGGASGGGSGGSDGGGAPSLGGLGAGAGGGAAAPDAGGGIIGDNKKKKGK